MTINYIYSNFSYYLYVVRNNDIEVACADEKTRKRVTVKAFINQVFTIF